MKKLVRFIVRNYKFKIWQLVLFYFETRKIRGVIRWYRRVSNGISQQKLWFSSRGGAYKLLGEENYTNVGTLQAELLLYSAAGHHSTTAPVSSTITLPDSRISLLLHSNSQSSPDVCGRPHQPVPFYDRGPHYMSTFDSAFE